MKGIPDESIPPLRLSEDTFLPELVRCQKCKFQYRVQLFLLTYDPRTILLHLYSQVCKSLDSKFLKGFNNKLLKQAKENKLKLS